MEGKLIKFKTHPGTFSKEELIVNIEALAKEKFILAVGDIIELSAPAKQEPSSGKKSTPLVLQVRNFPPELPSKGVVLSVIKDLASSIGFEGFREVNVRKVDREEVGLDLVELRFKDQSLTRSDMWRFSCSMMDKCVYESKRVEFGGMRCQASGLWSQGEMVQSGAVVDDTRVVFRSASSHFFIFIQISSEMWDFDSSGDLYFDKAEGGFLQELFQRWNLEQCTHEVTLAFFWRAYYKRSSIDKLPPDATVHTNKRGNFYEDFYKVIIQEETMLDWTSCLVEVKKHFLQLKDFMAKARGGHAIISHASEGNFLEAINLAVNVYEKSFQNCNFQLTGQQIVLVTPGVGVFEVERELTMMTRERITDSGVGVDLVSLTMQPLHAVPLFKFFSQSSVDNQEYYNLPHWINYSFYNPVHPWNQLRFQPRLNLSDHLISKKLENGCNSSEQLVKGLPYQPTKEAGLVPHTISSIETLQRARVLSKYLVNHEAHDAAIFSSKEDALLGRLGSKGMLKARSTGRMAISPDGRHFMQQQHSLGDHEGSLSQGVKFEINSSPEDETFYSSPFQLDPVSPSSESKLPAISENIGREAMSIEGDATGSSRSTRVRILSESQGPSSSLLATSSSHTLYVAAASSAESLPKYSRLIAHGHGNGVLDRGMDGQILVSTKKTKFINPFDPCKVHGELTAYHRRWVHAFPRDKRGLAFQIHHAQEGDEEEEEGEGLSVSSSTLSPFRNVSSGSLNVGSLSRVDGKGSSLSEQEFHGLSQQRAQRSRYVSGGSFVETLVPLMGDEERSQGSDSRVSEAEASSDSKAHSQLPTSNPRAEKWDDYGTVPGDLKETSKMAPPKPVWTKRRSRKAAAPCERRLSDASLKAIEDFTSVQRTGVDWKSLTEPACLPITVDFFPSESRLNQDYYQSPLELVANCCQNEFSDTEGSSDKYQCSWIADHQKVDTFEAFREMISQRLSQGFQLVFDGKNALGSKLTSSLPWSGQNGCHVQNNIFALHQALMEQKALLTSKNTDKRRKELRGRSSDICVKLSLGKVFQELKLVYPHIHVTVYKQKVQYSPKPFIYSYNLCRAWPILLNGHASSELQRDSVASKSASPLLDMRATFSYKRTEDYNWNYLDQHVCGYSDFEVLQESHRYWRCRYLLLPATPPPPPTHSIPDEQSEEEKKLIASREAILIASFVRFMEFLNHIKRQQNPTSSLYSQGSKIMKRNMSMPASYSMLHALSANTSISSRSTTGSSHTGSSHTGSSHTSSSLHPISASTDFSTRALSPSLTPIIQSPSGTKYLKKNSDGYATAAAGETPGKSHSSSRQATPLHQLDRNAEQDGSISRQQGKRVGSSTGDISTSPIPTSYSSASRKLLPHPANTGGSGTGGSPRLTRRKKSREDLLAASPNPDRPTSSQSRTEVTLTVADQPLSGRSSGESSDYGNSATEPGHHQRGSSPVSSSSQTKSPEMVADDVSTSFSSFDASIQLLNDSSPVSLIIRFMEHSSEGIDFLAPHVGLKSSSCFVAMEAVDWAMEKIGGVKTRRDATSIFQAMVQEQLIVHASMDLSIPFLDGYLLYCIPHSKTGRDARSSLKESIGGDVGFYMVSPDYETFCKRWFEVVVFHPCSVFLSSSPGDQPGAAMMDLSPASASPYATGYTTFASSSQPYYKDSGQLSMRIPNCMVNRYVELNPDPQFKSDRPEWCYVRYDHTYDPRFGFQLEFQWMVTTMVLISQLIQNWTHKAVMCGFNLVPVPMLHTLSKDEGDGTPFTPRCYIPLLLPSSFPGSTMPLSQAVGKVMAAIMQVLGFVLDPASISDDLQDMNLTLPITSRMYVHYSGCALVGPTCTDSVVRLMERDRRTRTSSLGTTLGRGDFADYNYMGEIMTEGRGDNYAPNLADLQIPLGEAETFLRGTSTEDGNWNHYQTPQYSDQGPLGPKSSSFQSLQCGFYWYKNMALDKHKGGAVTDCGTLQEKMVALCSNKDDSLTKLCADTLGIGSLDSPDHLLNS